MVLGFDFFEFGVGVVFVECDDVVVEDGLEDVCDGVVEGGVVVKVVECVVFVGEVLDVRVELGEYVGVWGL